MQGRSLNTASISSWDGAVTTSGRAARMSQAMGWNNSPRNCWICSRGVHDGVVSLVDTTAEGRVPLC